MNFYRAVNSLKGCESMTWVRYRDIASLGPYRLVETQ